MFKLPVFAQHTTWLLFQLSSQLFSASSMFLSNRLFLAFLLQTIHTFFCFSIVPSFPSSNSLNSFLFTTLLYSIVSAAFTPSINGLTEFLTYHPKLLSSIFIHQSPSSYFPAKQTLSISLLGCSPPSIIINFLVLSSKLFNSSISHFRISTY